MKREKHEVVVVGAGHAGLTAAKECLQAGVDHLLVEKDSILQPKKSIEAFSSTIKEFGLESAVVRWIKGDRYLVPGSKEPIDLVNLGRAVVDQKRFNELFVKEINYRDGVEVISAERNNGNALLKLSDGEVVEAKVVIDATGYSASVSRMLGEKVKLNSSHLSAGYQVEGDLSKFGIDDDTCLHFDFVADTRFGKRSAELWLYPFSERLFDIGWGYYLIKNDMKRLKGNALEECRKEIYPKLNSMVKEHFGATLSKPLREYYGMGNTTIVHKPYADNLLITGEAMGMVQPIYFYGFEPSLVYGKVAGQVAAEAVRKGSAYLKKYPGLIGEKEMCGYAWGNIAREAVTAGGAIIGNRTVEITMEILRKLSERDLKIVYDLIGQRKLSPDELLVILYPLLRTITKGILKAVREEGARSMVKNSLEYASDRFL